MFVLGTSRCHCGLLAVSWAGDNLVILSHAEVGSRFLGVAMQSFDYQGQVAKEVVAGYWGTAQLCPANYVVSSLCYWILVLSGLG